MQVEVNKNELAGALVALGKLICRTSPVEAYRSVQIVGKENSLHFRTAGSEESIEFKIQANITEDFAVIVDFELFRQAVRVSRNKCLVFEYADGMFAVDGLRMATVNCEFPKMPEMPTEGTKEEILPSTFVDLLNTAAPIVNRNDYRKVLQGINLSRDGITVSNGKELFNVPVQMEVESLTIPFPLALIATKATGMSKLAYWTDGVSVFFQITVADWTWTSKAVTGTYPNWKVVVPDQRNLTHRVEFAADQGTQLKNWLKTVPEDPSYTAMELGMANSETLSVKSLKGMTLNLPAQFTDDWGDYKLTVNRDLLLRLLSQGHTKLECPAEHGPFTAIGGIGQYIAMPLFLPKTEPKTKTKQEPKTEESNMNENTTVVPATMQVVAPNPEPITELSPLEELTATIDAFKAKLKSIFDESNVLSRKVKEVALSQKQKERDFILAKRAIERIRLASSF